MIAPVESASVCRRSGGNGRNGGQSDCGGSSALLNISCRSRYRLFRLGFPTSTLTFHSFDSDSRLRLRCSNFSTPDPTRTPEFQFFRLRLPTPTPCFNSVVLAFRHQLPTSIPTPDSRGLVFFRIEPPTPTPGFSFSTPIPVFDVSVPTSSTPPPDSDQGSDFFSIATSVSDSEV